MKTLLTFPRVALMALALGTASVPALMADDATTTQTGTCSKGGKHHQDAALTETEKAQLKKAHDAALAANPNLQAEGTALKQQFVSAKSPGATADRKSLHEQGRAYHAKLRAAELAIDPTLAPIFAKLDAAHQGGRHHHST